MKKSDLLTLAVFAFFAFAAANALAEQANALAEQSSAGPAPVHVVVTVEAHKGRETPVINREDVMVHEGHDRDAVIDSASRRLMFSNSSGVVFPYRSSSVSIKAWNVSCTVEAIFAEIIPCPCASTTKTPAVEQRSRTSSATRTCSELLANLYSVSISGL